MAPLVVGPAIGELTGAKPGTPDFNYWVGMFFSIPALVGGAFGLVGGYLTDRFGRRRVLVWSILLYAFSAFAAGFSTSVTMLLVLRSTTYAGVFVEFVAAVAWIAELFDNPKQRESALGYTQAFSSIGGIMVTAAYAAAVTYGDSLPAIHRDAFGVALHADVGRDPGAAADPHPAVPAGVAGVAGKKGIGNAQAPEHCRDFCAGTEADDDRDDDPVRVCLRRGVRRHPADAAHRAGPSRGPDALDSPAAADRKPGAGVPGSGRPGRPLRAGVPRDSHPLAPAAAARVSDPRLDRAAAGVLVPGTTSLELARWGMFFAGLFTVAQFSFWGNYLPRVYPTHLRGTGEGFAANVGGRMMGTGFAFVTTQLTNVMPGATPPTRLAYSAAVVGLFVYLVGLIVSRWLPEPKGEALPEWTRSRFSVHGSRFVFTFGSAFGVLVQGFGVRAPQCDRAPLTATPNTNPRTPNTEHRPRSSNRT